MADSKEAKEAIDVIADPVDKIACRKCARHLDVSGLPSFSIVECPECHTRQTVPAQLGQFLLLEILGSGGMGVVYQALDQALGRYVAIKVMKRSLGDDEQFVQNFLREARAAAAINHRNIVQIYSCGQEKGQPYIVMELVSGGKMDEMLAKGNPLDEARTLEIGIGVAEGLKAAHAVNLIHGDIKPANILFDKEGHAKVADFGLARFASSRAEPGEIWGTPYYIAPEKARGQKVDHRSDIYSLGATLYHALGAIPPFDGQTATDVVVARLKNPAIGLRVIRPALQPETADVIARMLEADPFMRYPTYDSVIADLKEALRIVRQEVRSPRAKAKKASVLPLLIVGGVIAFAVAILAGSWQYMSCKQKKPAPLPAGPAATNVPAATNQAATATQAVQSAQAPTGAPPSKTSFVPLTPNADQALANAMKLLAEGRTAAAEQQLQAIYEKSPANALARWWARLMQALTYWATGRDREAEGYLKDLKGLTFDPADGAQIHPGNLARNVAWFFMGELDEGRLFLDAAKRDAWYQDALDFFVGVQRLRKSELKGAATQFSTYLAKEGQQPAWAYSFKPLARSWQAQISAWQEQQLAAERLLKTGQYTKAREVLEQYRGSVAPILGATADKALAQVRQVEETELEKQRRAEQRQRQQQLQAELNLIDDIRGANLTLVNQKDFRKAQAAMSRILPQIKSGEGQKTFRLLNEAYERMDALKKFLIARIPVAPARRSAIPDLPGDAVSADLNGIQVALGQHGAMTITWDQASPKLIVQLADYYLNDPALAAEEKADKYLSTAVFCYEMGGWKWAADRASLAIKLNADLKAKALQLMPQIVPE